MVPIVTTLCTPASRHSSISCTPIIRFSKKNEPRVLPVGADPAHARGEVHDDVWPRVGQQAPARIPLNQVVVLLAGDQHLGPARTELGVDAQSEESRPSRHDDAFARQCHRSPSRPRVPVAVSCGPPQARERRHRRHARLASHAPTPTSRIVKIPPLNHASAMRTRGTNRRSTSSTPGGTITLTKASAIGTMRNAPAGVVARHSGRYSTDRKSRRSRSEGANRAVYRPSSAASRTGSGSRDAANAV